jgi:tetratricopeptide (TPR) repeat protein
MLTRLARVYRTFGRYEEAERTSRKAIAIQTGILGEQNPLTLTSMNSLVFTLLYRNKYKESEELGRKVSELRARVLGPEHADTLLAQHNLALALAHRLEWEQAEQLYAKVLDTQTRVLGPEHPDTLATAGDFAKCYQDQGKFKEAAALFERTLELQRRTLGENHSNALNSIQGLGAVYQALGRYSEAETVIRRSFELQRGPGTQLDLAALYLHAQRLGEALPIARQALEGMTKTRGPRSRRTLEATATLAAIEDGLGRTAEAARLLAPVPGIARAQGGASAEVFGYTAQLAGLRIKQKDYTAAERLLRESLGGVSDSSSWQHAYAQSLLGHVLMLEARPQEAAPLLTASLAEIERQKDTIPAYHRDVVEKARKWAGAAKGVPVN